MNIVLFCHPSFMTSQSMPRFARMLQEAYIERGHRVQVWAPKACVFQLIKLGRLRKWAGYLDQYIIFPIWVRISLLTQPRDTLFVFCDQALGPWVPLVRGRHHIVHAHDLLALRSAMGLIPENPTSWSGKLYQNYIRTGFQHAQHFISVSNKTKRDLVEFGRVQPLTSYVVYNGLNYPFKPVPFDQAQAFLTNTGIKVSAAGVLLHISGNQWYKNVVGVIHLYAEYAKTQAVPLPLWLIGVGKTDEVRVALAEIPPAGHVEFFYKFSNEQIQAAYSVARAFLFPSLAEGFGWPIVEAQACGCAVITTDEAPMNEIGGPEAKYLPRLTSKSNLAQWSKQGAIALNQLLESNPKQEDAAKLARVAWASKFNADTTIAQYLKIYELVLHTRLS